MRTGMAPGGTSNRYAVPSRPVVASVPPASPMVALATRDVSREHAVAVLEVAKSALLAKAVAA